MEQKTYDKFISWFGSNVEEETGEELAEMAFFAGHSEGLSEQEESGKFDFMREQQEELDSLKRKTSEANLLLEKTVKALTKYKMDLNNSNLKTDIREFLERV